MRTRSRDQWLAIFGAGRFSEVPEDLQWDPDGRTIASCINGYELAAALGFHLPEQYRMRMATNSFDETTLQELWALMSFKARNDHFSVLPAGLLVTEDPVEVAGTAAMCMRFAMLCHTSSNVEIARLTSFLLDDA